MQLIRAAVLTALTRNVQPTFGIQAERYFLFFQVLDDMRSYRGDDTVPIEFDTSVAESCIPLADKSAIIDARPTLKLAIAYETAKHNFLSLHPHDDFQYVLGTSSLLERFKCAGSAVQLIDEDLSVAVLV